MIRVLALALLLAASVGALYEWGGPARRGVRELEQRRYGEALRDLRKGRADFPGEAVIPYDEGLAHLGRGAADSAASCLQEAMRLRGLKPRQAAAYNLGNLAMRAGDFETAARYYKDALRLRPEDGDAKRNLEEALRRMRKPEIRNPKSPPSGGEGPRNPRGEQPPQPSPAPSMAQSPPPRGGPGAFTREEAERWLEALEAQRRAKRQESKGRSAQENGNRDW